MHYGNFAYAIGHVQSDEIGGVRVIRGQIGRIPQGEEGFAYNLKEKDFVKREKGEFADIILDFCVIPQKHILLIQQHVSFKPETVANKFKNIYVQSNQSYVGSFNIDFVTDKADVYKEIASWKAFTKVKFQGLRPSNPSPNDDFADIEKMLKELGADKVSIDASVNPQTKKEIEEGTPPKAINADSFLVSQALALSSHGYGRAELEGLDENGRHKEVKTYAYRKTVEIDFSDDGSIAKIKQIVEGAQGADDEK